MPSVEACVSTMYACAGHLSFKPGLLSRSSLKRIWVYFSLIKHKAVHGKFSSKYSLLIQNVPETQQGHLEGQFPLPTFFRTVPTDNWNSKICGQTSPPRESPTTREWGISHFYYVMYLDFGLWRCTHELSNSSNTDTEGGPGESHGHIRAMIEDSCIALSSLFVFQFGPVLILTLEDPRILIYFVARA